MPKIKDDRDGSGLRSGSGYEDGTGFGDGAENKVGNGTEFCDGHGYGVYYNLPGDGSGNLDGSGYGLGNDDVEGGSIFTSYYYGFRPFDDGYGYGYGYGYADGNDDKDIDDKDIGRGYEDGSGNG